MIQSFTGAEQSISSRNAKCWEAHGWPVDILAIVAIGGRVRSVAVQKMKRTDDMIHCEQRLYPSPVGWGLELYYHILSVVTIQYIDLYWGFSMILIIHGDFPSFLSTMTGQSSICCSFEAERSWKSPKVSETLRLVSKDHGNPWKIRRVPQLIWINYCVLHPLSRCFMVFP